MRMFRRNLSFNCWNVVSSFPEPVVGALEGMNVNLTCVFTDDQRARAGEVTVYWKRGNGNSVENHNAVTTWDKDAQIGNSIITLRNITVGDSDKFTCLVGVGWSLDYKYIQLRVGNWERNDTGIIITPTTADVDMWDGPPLRVNCSSTTQDSCGTIYSVTWWKWNSAGLWDKPKGRSNAWVTDQGGMGWYNETQPRLGESESEGKYICIVVCGMQSSYGEREVKGRAHLGQGMRPSHGVYRAVAGSPVILMCKLDLGMTFSEFGWWFGEVIFSKQLNTRGKRD
uniref:Ig-like domain-containing protein n=1 Tax=Serinus canaria TaxID=9135 RepID=A0A8C9NJ39_SERCA